MFNIPLIKERGSLLAIWHLLGLEGEPRPGKTIRCPFPENHKHGDKSPSCGVSKDGKSLCCMACGYRGDFIQVYRDKTGVIFKEACVILSKHLGLETTETPMSHKRPQHSAKLGSSSSRVITDLPCLIPPGLNILFEEGCQVLRNSPQICAKIDRWRSWPEGTTRLLAEDGLLSYPKINGVPGLAFSVEAPCLDELGLVVTQRIGFHFRPKTKPGQKATWRYYPNQKQGGRKTSPMPFILGGGHLSIATRIIILEGQWDAVCFASQLGWLKHDASWPEGIVVVAVPGKTSFRPFLSHYLRLIPQSTHFILMPDKDAETSWKQDFAEKRLVNKGYNVLWQCLKDKDFTDTYRNRNCSHEELISQLHTLLEQPLTN